MNSYDLATEKRNEVVDGVIRLLRLHKDSVAGSIHQDPYKSGFFRFFADAYNSGLMKENRLKSDALANMICERAPDLIDLTPNSTYSNLLIFWSEWTYAWDRSRELIVDR